MGRVLSGDRKHRAIAYWRKRISALDAAAAAGLRRDLIAILGPESERALTRSNRPSPVVNELADALNSDGTMVLDAWIERRLVQRGPDLLISEVRRKRVLASMRDADHHERQKLRAKETMTIRISAEAGFRLRAYQTQHGLVTEDAAIAALLKLAAKATPASRQAAKPDPSGDLLANLSIDVNDKAGRKKPASP